MVIQRQKESVKLKQTDSNWPMDSGLQTATLTAKQTETVNWMEKEKPKETLTHWDCKMGLLNLMAI